MKYIYHLHDLDWASDDATPESIVQDVKEMLQERMFGEVVATITGRQNGWPVVMLSFTNTDDMDTLAAIYLDETFGVDQDDNPYGPTISDDTYNFELYFDVEAYERKDKS